MGDRVVNENPVIPFDHRNLSLARATKPFSHACCKTINQALPVSCTFTQKAGKHKMEGITVQVLETSSIYTGPIQATSQKQCESSMFQCGRVFHPLQYPDVNSVMLIYSKIQL